MPVYRDLRRIPLLVLPAKIRPASYHSHRAHAHRCPGQDTAKPSGGATTNCSPGLPQSRNRSPIGESGSLSHNPPQGECPKPSAVPQKRTVRLLILAKHPDNAPDSEPHLLIIALRE